MTNTPQTGAPAPDYTLTTHDVTETQRLGAIIGGLTRAGDTVLLLGNLGAGKTSLVQGLARGLGITQPVNSPTFILIGEYLGRLPLYHVDLYRLEQIEQVEAIGLDDVVLGSGVTVIEWAERAGPLVPPEYVAIRIRHRGDTDREIELYAEGERPRQFIAAIRQAWEANDA